MSPAIWKILLIAITSHRCPHAGVLTKGLFSLFPDVERPRYADEHAEDKLEKMLMEVLKED